jgi:hypothetical protein
MNSQKTLM